jgi:hypothetical protein
MIRCLDDRELLDLRDGDAPPEAETHASSCVRCARRVTELERDLALLTRVLRDAPVPQTSHRALAWLFPAASAAAVVVGSLLVFWGTRTGDVPPHALPVAAVRDTVAEERRLREVSRALFALDPLDPVVQLRRQSELGLIEAALGGEHPCERRSTGCDW